MDSTSPKGFLISLVFLLVMLVYTHGETSASPTNQTEVTSEDDQFPSVSDYSTGSTVSVEETSPFPTNSTTDMTTGSDQRNRSTFSPTNTAPTSQHKNSTSSQPLTGTASQPSKQSSTDPASIQVSEGTTRGMSHTEKSGDGGNTAENGGFTFLSYVMGVVTTLLVVVILIFVRKILRIDRIEHAALHSHVNHNSSRESFMLTDLGVANGPSNELVTPMVIEVKYLPSISIKDLSQYVKENRSNGSLKLQFHDLIPNNPTLAMIAANGANIMKNRYKNIFPNDATRVILTSRVNTEDVGYINASYINGNEEEISYIATQGPLLSTLDDFWLMSWQESVEKIIMLTHLSEGENRVKCEKYWPDEGMEISYGGITVKCTSDQTFFSYILRTMDVSFGDEKRVIKQYHFIAWPDKKIPDDSSRLLRFIQEATPVTESITNPVIVHCSAGIGRTGVYIAIDRHLRMLLKETSINIFNCCQDMRSSRPWMVQTVEQYLFIYECVLEWTLCGDTFIPAADFVKRANMSDVEKKRQEEFTALESVVPSGEELRQKHGRLERNKERNRCEEVVPHDGSRVILQREDAENDYINASFIDGFVKPNEFISTQVPFQHTKQDFWEMAYEYDVTTIVLLDDGEKSEEDIPYWPGRDDDLVYGAISIRYETEDKCDTHTKTTFSIHHEEDPEEIQCVLLYHITQLPSLHGSLTLLDPVCDVIQAIKAGKRNNPHDGLTLVQCLDGATQTGVFIASKMCADQMELENGTDVFQAVKRVRKVQPKMVESESQYNLIFRVMERLIEKEAEEDEPEEVAYANYRKGSATVSTEETTYANAAAASEVTPSSSN